MRDEEARRVGLCTSCRHARVQRNGRGSAFWRCERAENEPRFLRYPPLPVLACSGHEPPAGPAGRDPRG